MSIVWPASIWLLGDVVTLSPMLVGPLPRKPCHGTGREGSSNRWLVSLTTSQPSGENALQARDLPLQGVSTASPRSDDIAIVVGDRPNQLTHEVRNAAGVALDLTSDGAERALLIHARDGTTTRVEFRSPMRPEEVDGMP